MILCFAVCWSAPQLHAGLLDKPHLHISALKRPTPVRSLLSLTQACHGRLDPGQHLDGETICVQSHQKEAFVGTVVYMFTSL